MKKITIQILMGLLAAATARADTALTIPALYSCFTDLGSVVGIPSPPTIVGTFNLNGVSGPGYFQSQVPSYWDEKVPPDQADYKFYIFNYSIDLSAMSPTANHCVKLLIHFGSPGGCFNPGVEGSPSQIQSATLNPWGDITFVFNGGCLNPGQPAVSFSMVGGESFKTNIVTVIDDYVDQASGQTNEVRFNVPAIVPDVPPDPPPWEIAYYYSRVNPVLFQGDLSQMAGTNQTGTNLPPLNGAYDFALQLLTLPTNGPVASLMVTQRVSVVNGLFTVPLPGDPVAFGDGSVRYLNIGVRPSGSGGGFTELVPAVQIAATPQADYAFSAGTVADLMPGQAVTSLNGLTDAVNLQAGSGIILGTNGNTLTISAQPAGVSDRNLKTDFTAVNSGNILAKLAALPIESWRYTNETPGIRHVGPMAQDFKAAFGLGATDKMIGYLDASGVAMAAIQGLNEKVEAGSQRSEVKIRQLEAENADLKARLEKIEQFINTQQKGAK